ncbi:tol-pal system protein YbgF [Orbaceae bacterium ESL0727]|nr:tol-pal system protein YbgF [Orbaceae bacterium ESL0727]
MYKKILCLCVFFLFAGYGCAAGSSSELERTVQAQGQLLIESQQRINDLQSELDALRGQLEENTYQLNQVIERQKMIFQQLANGSGFSSSSNNNSDNRNLNNSANSSADSNAANSNANASSNTNANSTISEPAAQTDTAVTTASPATKDLIGWTTSGNDKNDYNFIMQFVTDGKQNNEAIVAFQKFLKAYPKSSYQANANYWLGQLLYRQGKKDDASFYYATVVKNYASSPKAADSLYKVGLILLEKGDKANAKLVFQRVINQYPKDKNSVDQAHKKLASL